MSPDTAVVPDLDINAPLPWREYNSAPSEAQPRSDIGQGPSRRLGSWAQRSWRAATNFCLGFSNEDHTDLPTQLHHSLGRRTSHHEYQAGSGTLEEVVRQGWDLKRPPGSDEAGPSNWFHDLPLGKRRRRWIRSPLSSRIFPLSLIQGFVSHPVYLRTLLILYCRFLQGLIHIRSFIHPPLHWIYVLYHQTELPVSALSCYGTTLNYYLPCLGLIRLRV